ncbi:MAG: hypothetical protein ACSHYF_16825 [Verrucomicrobiaceae bacterium]
MLFTAASENQDSDSVRAIRVGEQIWQIQYGILDDKVSYLVFDGPKKLPYSNIVSFTSSSVFDPTTKKSRVVARKAILDLPDWRDINLVNSGKTLLVSENQVLEIQLRFTPKLLDEFLRSNPKEITGASLEQFVKSKLDKKSKANKSE